MQRTWISSLPIVAALALSCGVAWADYFKNGDLKEGLAGWHDGGDMAYLKPDGTEGSETDSGVTPVIKLVLSSSRPSQVSQEFDTREMPTSMHVKVDVYASNDFQKAKPENGTIGWKPGGTWYWSALVVPDVDFWIRGGPGWFYKLASLTPGQWTTVDGTFDGIRGTEHHVILFCAPAGQGTVYLKNPLAE